MGAPCSRSDIGGGLDRIEDWYVGDGWYTNGHGRNFDYYIGWAMHLYDGARAAAARRAVRAVHGVARARWLLHGTPQDGIVRLINHGSDHNPLEGPATDDPHYAKLAYSTATSPEAAPHAWVRATDNHLALLAPDGTPSRRRRIHPLTCEDRRASSRHDAYLPGCDETFPVESTSLLHGPWELRVHRVEAPADIAVREGGYAVADSARPHSAQGPGWALTRTESGLTSVVVGLYGWDEETGVAEEVEANAFGPYSAAPCLRATGRTGGPSVHVSLVALTRDSVHPEALRTTLTRAVRTTER
ncbi:DUF2264 domain-containing protein [Streptomyces sp. NPDC048370]|uniref:DUF2264 domain-containing protein n=1 Tax=Streptomyces sp. NPDC048370 TaxID=3365540 RepID=UPI0037144D35